MEDFRIDYWIPKATSIDLLRVSDSDSDSGVDPNTKSVARASYRPKSDRAELESLLYAWRLKIRTEDRSTAIFPLDDILSSKAISLLARLNSGVSETSSAEALSTFLHESKEWAQIYAPEVCDIIYQYDMKSLAAKPTKKVKEVRSQPQDQFTGVMKLGISMPTNSEDLGCSMAVLNLGISGISKPSAKRPLASGSSSSSSKRVKHEALAEISLNKQ